MNVFAKIYPLLANFERETFLKNKESEIICFSFLVAMRNVGEKYLYISKISIRY